MVRSPKVLLVYPAFPPSYRGFQYPLAQSRRGQRASLIDLGERLTGDAARAELAFERAFALI